MDVDGLKTVEETDLRSLALNVDFTIDEFSPFSNFTALNPPEESLLVDRYYGQVYHKRHLSPAAVYGRTADLPNFSGDDLANNGFLRVPFRRIPRRLIRSRRELDILLKSIRSADPSLKLLLRGQTHEYFVKRSPEVSQWLYGEDKVLEPSIVTSASRRSPVLEDVLPEWGTLLKIFTQLHDATRNHVSGPNGFNSSFGFPLFAIALAQHYGLPTSGLDLTTDINAALFFALMQYKKSNISADATYVRADHKSPPVIYVLSVSERQQFSYDQFRPEGFPIGRPQAQSAFFMHVGWGHSINACARRVFLALYLDPEADWGPLPSVEDMFPSHDRDVFAEFLKLQYSKGLLPSDLKKAFDSGFYVIRP